MVGDNDAQLKLQLIDTAEQLRKDAAAKGFLPKSTGFTVAVAEALGERIGVNGRQLHGAMHTRNAVSHRTEGDEPTTREIASAITTLEAAVQAVGRTPAGTIPFPPANRFSTTSPPKARPSTRPAATPAQPTTAPSSFGQFSTPTPSTTAPPLRQVTPAWQSLMTHPAGLLFVVNLAAWAVSRFAEAPGPVAALQRWFAPVLIDLGALDNFVFDIGALGRPVILFAVSVLLALTTLLTSGRAAAVLGLEALLLALVAGASLAAAIPVASNVPGLLVLVWIVGLSLAAARHAFSTADRVATWGMGAVPPSVWDARVRTAGFLLIFTVLVPLLIGLWGWSVAPEFGQVERAFGEARSMLFVAIPGAGIVAVAMAALLFRSPIEGRGGTMGFAAIAFIAGLVALTWYPNTRLATDVAGTVALQLPMTAPGATPATAPTTVPIEATPAPLTPVAVPEVCHIAQLATFAERSEAREAGRDLAAESGLAVYIAASENIPGWDPGAWALYLPAETAVVATNGLQAARRFGYQGVYLEAPGELCVPAD